jgi:CheY-like chemotaxis protein
MKYNVLIVDDVTFSSDVVKHFIEAYGIHVDCVTTGEQAIELIRIEETIYNAVFVDQSMPVMDGVQTARRIRGIGTKYAGTIPLIAISGEGDDYDKTAFLCRGFQDFVKKPVNASKIEKVIRRWVVDEFKDYSVNDEETLAEFKRSFADNIPALLEKAREFRDLSNYAILIHGIMGSCRNIREYELADRAGKLEKAAKSGDADFIRANNSVFIEAVEKLIAGLDVT